MGRVPFFLLTLLAFTTMASAQTVTPFNPSHPTSSTGVPLPPVSPEMVLARMMSFDRNDDGLVSKGELPERMQSLLVGDVTRDEALDGNEIRSLAASRPAAAAATVPGFPGGGGGYTFGDQIGLSTRSHVEGALDDLRLQASTRERALPIITAFIDALEADASAVLLKELEAFATPEQLASFKGALDRQISGRREFESLVNRFGSNAKFVMKGSDLAPAILAFQLPPWQTRVALTALEGFKARIRVDDADRSALLLALKDVLSNDDRENFGAALRRRPLVKADGLTVDVRNMIPRPVAPGDVVSGPAIFRMPFPPQRVVEP
jgi:hypothetical protein